MPARLTTLPSTSHRDRAIHLVRLCAAHPADSAPDAAAIAGLGAVAEARRAESMHALADLRALDTALTRAWPRRPEVGQLHTRLLAASKPGT